MASNLSGTGSSFESFTDMAASSDRIASLLSFGFDGAIVHCRKVGHPQQC